ncbi:MAG: CCA tRNA nucleotidyltransferase [Candidatus Dormibacteria bacterium]
MATEIREIRDALPIEALLDHIGACARDAGVEAYLVGGFVRDRLLGRPLGKDIDVVVVGSVGTPLLERVARRPGWSRPAIFERFGTGMTQGEGYVVEVVQARAERYDPESRKPDVRPGTLEEDIRRRDFTINALAQSFSGQVLDLTGQGVADLHTGILRTPLDPAETFSEDPLRMFRAARFVSQLGFHLADGMIAAIRCGAHRAGILSAERVRDELCRLLLGTHPRDGLNVLREGGLLTLALPELEPMIGVEQGGWHVHDVWEHTLHAVELAPPNLRTRVAALFHDVGKPATHAITEDGKHTFYDHANVGAGIAETVLQRLRFSNEEVAAVAQLVRLHLRPIQYDPSTHSDSAVRRLIRDAGPLRRELLDLARADTGASAYPTTATLDEMEGRMAALDAGGAVVRLRPPLDGHRLQAITGRRPGPWIGAVQRALVDAILDGEFAADDTAAAETWLADHPGLLS